MQKITQIEVTKTRTKFRKDIHGKRIRDKELYKGHRKVRTVAAGPRIGHYIVDSIIFYFLLLVFFFVTAIFLSAVLNTNTDVILDSPFINFIALLLYPTYYFTCEKLWQQTPGKKMTKTVVIDDYADKPTDKQLLLRSIIRLVPFEAFSCTGDHSYGWHDKWSNTWVVTTEERDKLKELLSDQGNVSHNSDEEIIDNI